MFEHLLECWEKWYQRSQVEGLWKLVQETLWEMAVALRNFCESIY